MLLGIKGWLTWSREFSVCVHVPKAEAGPVPGSKDGDMKAGTASQRLPFINQAMPHCPQRDRPGVTQSEGEGLQRKWEEADF